MGTCVKRFFHPNKPVCSTGSRFKFYYPAGGTYSGYWKCNQHHGWGVKETAARQASYYAGKKQPQGQLIYKGNWVLGKRQGCGTMIRKCGKDMQTVYTGQWYDDMKCGEGKQFYTDGCVYFGNWLRNRRHGLGIQWYGDGSIYVGEWQTDFKHGLGVLFLANGNRYEGHFARGYKNGEGCFYHMHTGQLQKGMWDNDVAIASVMQDETLLRRQDAVTPYAIPRNYLKYPNQIMRELFQRYSPLADKPRRRFNDSVNLEFVHHQRQFASFDQRMTNASQLDLNPNPPYVCTCSCQRHEQEQQI
ncbi:MORN repeat-containing protein 3 [Drosophila busckii]|uniref:MORN repeat-containing protein 3 n=1 Tax=Drosophila busckii TaxID=30019 RepID=UPI00083EE4AB|nr:MORN repeat-containing protein 3 [Drosophila busckii]